MAWCKDNNVSLNTRKIKELVINFRKQSGGDTFVCINGSEVEVVKSFKFLEVIINSNLPWSIHIDTSVKKTHQCPYFLRRLRKFGMSTMILTIFTDAPKENILLRCITAWYVNCSAQDDLRKDISYVTADLSVHFSVAVTLYSAFCSITPMYL
eukprot:g25586.t1